MRTSRLGILALLAIPLFLSGCGNESSSSDLSSSDRKFLASFGSSMSGFAGMAKEISSAPKGFAAGFQTTAGRVAAGCSIDTSYVRDGETTTLRATKPDGSAFSTCSEIAAAIRGDGIVIEMTMSKSGNPSMSGRMKAFSQLSPLGILTMTMDMTMDMSGTDNGQSIVIKIDPIHVECSAPIASSADPTMDGYMTISVNEFAFAHMVIDENGLVAQTITITKSGTPVANMVVDADGNVTIKDLDGNVISG